jgi:protein-tyrosine phosphatase
MSGSFLSPPQEVPLLTEARASDGTGPSRLVFVCHANHCRSPMMELLLRAALAGPAAAGPALLVSSAGTHARAGTPAHPFAVRALAEHGVDATGWGATPLDVDGVERADLVLTAAVAQRDEVVALSAAAAGRTFTLLDFSTWLAAAPAGTPDASAGAAGLLARAVAGRARSGDRHPGRDLPDPMGRSLRHFRLCRRRVEAALVPFLGPGDGSARVPGRGR